MALPNYVQWMGSPIHSAGYSPLLPAQLGTHAAFTVIFLLQIILLQVKDPIVRLLKVSDQIGPERERKGASCKVRASSVKATVFLFALQCFCKGSDLPG